MHMLTRLCVRYEAKHFAGQHQYPATGYGDPFNASTDQTDRGGRGFNRNVNGDACASAGRGQHY